MTTYYHQEEKLIKNDNLQYYKLPIKNANIYYIPSFLSIDLADYYQDRLMNTLNFQKREREGRLTALHGDSDVKYTYALNNNAITNPWTDELLVIKEMIESKVSHKYDVCLINYYRNGKESFNFHCDKEEIGNPVPLISLSLGAKRKFYFKSKTDSEEKYCVELDHGSLLIMAEGTQENYLHSLPPDKKIKIPRLNLTFRKAR